LHCGGPISIGRGSLLCHQGDTVVTEGFLLPRVAVLFLIP
jgi:hypothetical protein